MEAKPPCSPKLTSPSLAWGAWREVEQGLGVRWELQLYTRPREGLAEGLGGSHGVALQEKRILGGARAKARGLGANLGSSGTADEEGLGVLGGMQQVFSCSFGKSVQEGV